MKQLTNALAWADRAIEYDEQRCPSWVIRGDILAAMGTNHFTNALQSYDRALALSPDNPSALIGKGWVLNYLGSYQDAFAIHLKAVKLQPRNTQAWRIGTYALVRMQQYDRAFQTIERALFQDEASASLWNDKALALRGLNRLDDALEAVEKSLVLESGFEEAKVNRDALLEARRSGKQP